MSISLDGLTSTYLTQSSENVSSSAASQVSSSISGLSSDSTEEDLTEAVKSFESYMLEQVIKQMEESVKSINDDDDDDSNSQLTDYYMDATIQTIASELIDSDGGNLTSEFVDSLKRTYNIE